jgi:signal transduction histidine kinase
LPLKTDAEKGFAMNSRRTVLIATLSMWVALPVLAEERGTKEEAKALAEAAVAHIKAVGVDQASKDFSTGKAKWQPKDLYPFVQDFAGNMIFHVNEKLVGKNVLAFKDSSGKEFGKEMLNLAKGKGNGWVDYDWAHPVTRKIEDKTTYVLRVPASEVFVGVGTYR